MTIPDLRAKQRSLLGLGSEASDNHILTAIRALDAENKALRDLLTRSRIAYSKPWAAVRPGEYICERGESLALWVVLGEPVAQTEDEITLPVMGPSGDRREVTKRRSDEVQVFSPSPLQHEQELLQLLAVELGARLAEACEET